jgi:hypothetical protein
MEVTVVAYEDCDVEVFVNEKDALQYVINTEIKEGGSCEEDRAYLEGLSVSDWNRDLRGICSIYTATLHEGAPN